MATLLENYAKRISVAESVYSEKNHGAKLSDSKKIALATVLDNTSKFLTEAFNNSIGTQRADMGMFKKFALNLTTVTLPNLIASDLVIVHPMTSMSGYINYLKFTKGTNKGASKQGDVVNSVFGLGDVDVNYTAATINEAHKATSAEATAKKFVVDWAPVVSIKGVKIGTQNYSIITEGTPTADTSVLVNVEEGSITFASGDTLFVADAEVKVLYIYDNEVIPQNDLPILNGKMESIGLVAKARRIAVYYSQMAAFQAKQDYGFDLGDDLAEQAVAELSYEIDTEITQLLIDNAVEPTSGDTTWNKALPVGVSKADHFEGFGEIITNASIEVYNRTKKHMPNYLIISSSILPVIKYVPGWTAAPVAQYNGPYFAGSVDNLKVFVTPNIDKDYFVVGVNGADMRASAAVYAPYMAIVPTQLLQYNDGGTTQGWSTLYDLKLLNPDLLVKGHIYKDATEIVNNTISNKVVSD